MQIGDRVVWLGANPEGWSGNGRAVIADYQKARPHFEGTSPGTREQPSTGPAIGLLIDQGDPNNPKKYDVWVRPSSEEIGIDPNPLVGEEKAA